MVVRSTSDNNDDTDTDDDEGPVTKTTELTGYLTGDHVSSLLFPEPDATDASRDRLHDEGIYLRDLIPDAATDGEHEFTITVEATPTEQTEGGADG